MITHLMTILQVPVLLPPQFDLPIWRVALSDVKMGIAAEIRVYTRKSKHGVDIC